MNFLFLNNYHYLRGGSEQVYFGEMDLLTSHGHLVHAFARKTENDIISTYSDFFPDDMMTDSLSLRWETFRTLKEILYSSESKRQLGKLMEVYQPDLVHAHNIYGRLTTSVLDLLKKKDIPVVMTLHDYKLICPSYKLMDGKKVCEECRGGRYYKAVANKCHKNSFAASGIYAFESWMNDFFKKYRANISFFIAPSRFLRNKLIEFGWSEKQVVYIPNYIESEKFDPVYEAENYLLYIGRLSGEKGIGTLIRAFGNANASQARLKVVGDGPEKERLMEIASSDSRIEFTGYLSGQALADVTRNSGAVVIPSEWYENAPISILEAFAYGKPVIGANIGGIPEMIDDGMTGMLFESGNVEALTDQIDWFFNLEGGQVSEMGCAARKKAENIYNSERHYELLMDVYQDAIQLKRPIR